MVSTILSNFAMEGFLWFLFRAIYRLRSNKQWRLWSHRLRRISQMHRRTSAWRCSRWYVFIFKIFGSFLSWFSCMCWLVNIFLCIEHFFITPSHQNRSSENITFDLFVISFTHGKNLVYSFETSEYIFYRAVATVLNIISKVSTDFKRDQMWAEQSEWVWQFQPYFKRHTTILKTFLFQIENTSCAFDANVSTRDWSNLYKVGERFYVCINVSYFSKSVTSININWLARTMVKGVSLYLRRVWDQLFSMFGFFAVSFA